MNGIEICFTGFDAVDRQNLINLAESAGMIARKNITKNLHLVCAGQNAGPTKIARASEFNIPVIDPDVFDLMLTNHQLPDEVQAALDELKESRAKSLRQKLTEKHLLDTPVNTHAENRFNAHHNKRKALLSLQGILTGIVCDNRLKEIELSFLMAWLKDNPELADDPDTIDLVDLIEDVLSDGIVTADEREDITSLIDCVLEYKAFDIEAEKDLVNVFLGVLNGVCADGLVNDEEIAFLVGWITEHPELITVWPVSAIAEHLADFIEADSISDTAREELKDYLQKITGTAFAETGAPKAGAFECFDPVTVLQFSDTEFCFTGKFRSGSRSQIEQRLLQLGGFPSKCVRKTTRYLVVGSEGNENWLTSSFGRKIKQAMEYKEAGQDLLIIPEDVWIQVSNNPL
ncbi:BRCT domain-containing protein [Shewanella algae]|uniref:BRCT domain-containing protein n=1 Tax=Shewanella algae TaxID=38313 RepID=UPI0031F514AC